MSTLYYSLDTRRHIVTFYAIVLGKKKTLGKIHAPSPESIDRDKICDILNRMEEIQPRALNTHISDILDTKGRPKDLKLYKTPTGKRWQYTYANGMRKSVTFDNTRRTADALYFAELIKLRYDIEPDSISAKIVEHACLHLV